MDGHVYLALVNDHESKIMGIRCWEQAFRVYAAVYTEAHPERASEIWQYVYTINSAAQSYKWQNVAYYDFTFHQLMVKKPWHSWVKTYTQGWNLALKEPLTKQVFSSTGGGAGMQQANSDSHNKSHSNGKQRTCG